MRATMLSCLPIDVSGNADKAGVPAKALLTSASVLMERLDTLFSSFSSKVLRVSVIRRRAAVAPAADPYRPDVTADTFTAPCVVSWYWMVLLPACMMLLPATDMAMDTPLPGLKALAVRSPMRPSHPVSDGWSGKPVCQAPCWSECENSCAGVGTVALPRFHCTLVMGAASVPTLASNATRCWSNSGLSALREPCSPSGSPL